MDRMVYELHRGDEVTSEDMDAKLEEVDAKKEQLAELRDQLASMRSVSICPNCGRTCSREDSFCPGCGTEL